MASLIDSLIANGVCAKSNINSNSLILNISNLLSGGLIYLTTSKNFLYQNSIYVLQI